MCRGLFSLRRLALIACLLPLHALSADDQTTSAMAPEPYAAIDDIFRDFSLDAHIPGLVYGIVAGGKLVHVRTYGVQDLETQTPVTPDSLFRIASMTKAFTALTILKLRDDGLLRLDADAEQYVPELRNWSYPTDDSPRIRVRDLLNHTGGLVTDDPWGDRQQPLPEDAFTEFLNNSAPFTRAPRTAFEYSNLGYALLGRTITNVSGRPFADTISTTLLGPLDMASSGFEADEAPREQRAIGYRWENDAWRQEPTLAHGTFGAMGGLQTSANDYARWVAFLLSGWPARDGADNGPVKRATIRELATGSNFPDLINRSVPGSSQDCAQAYNYGMGMGVRLDCRLGRILSHGGGYPGYGSYVALLPDRGVGLFVFANRTYAPAYIPMWEAAAALEDAGLLGGEPPLPVGTGLLTAYANAGAIFAAGDVLVANDSLAMNFLLDRGADIWAQNLAELKAEVGNCETSSEMTATGALSADFTWRCEHGRIQGSLLLAPTRAPRIQQLQLEVITP
jgi:CubicO group peptidase (beta-lactamase class C family)